MCLKFVTERAEIYHGYKCGIIEDGWFRGFNFTGRFIINEWVYAKGSSNQEDENKYPHGFHIFPDINDAIKFMGIRTGYDWSIYKVSYRGILARGFDIGDTKVDVAAMMYVNPKPVKLEPDFSGV